MPYANPRCKAAKASHAKSARKCDILCANCHRKQEIEV